MENHPTSTLQAWLSPIWFLFISKPEKIIERYQFSIIWRCKKRCFGMVQIACPSVLHRWLKSWHQRLQRCIYLNGSYIENKHHNLYNFFKFSLHKLFEAPSWIRIKLATYLKILCASDIFLLYLSLLMQPLSLTTLYWLF